jgi:hypothetical protein
LAALAIIGVTTACAITQHMGPTARPAELVGEWVDLRHTTPADTTLWVLRGDGYDGTGHIFAARSTGDPPHRTDQKFGTWYLRGEMRDSTRTVCFVKRVGRDGPLCVGFSLDTVAGSDGTRRHLVLRGYRGEHHVGDDELVERPLPR